MNTLQWKCHFDKATFNFYYLINLTNDITNYYIANMIILFIFGINLELINF